MKKLKIIFFFFLFCFFIVLPHKEKSDKETEKKLESLCVAAMLSLEGIKSFVSQARLGQTRIQCEACRAKAKLFILLRLNMAAVW